MTISFVILCVLSIFMHLICQLFGYAFLWTEEETKSNPFTRRYLKYIALSMHKRYYTSVYIQLNCALNCILYILYKRSINYI